MRSSTIRARLVAKRLAVIPAIVLLLLPCGGCEVVCQLLGLPVEACGGTDPFGGRPIQKLQVAIEVRFLGVTDEFFDRIGVDFDFNLDSDAMLNPVNGSNPPPPSNQPANPFLTTPSQVGGQEGAHMFVPRQLIDTSFFLPTTANRGDVPQANHFPRLPVHADIPLTGLFNPPNSDNLPGGSIVTGMPAVDAASIGFAILSDIESSFFLQAAQGDSRNAVLAAPKLTLFSGQSAVSVSRNEMTLINDVVPAFAQAAQTVIPLVQNVYSGPTINVTPVISSDRRFLQLNLQPVIAMFTDAQTFQFNGVNHTIQFPVVQFTNVQTTVTVPDGGTVLLGGIKRAADGPLEPGVPILGKVPYIGRLFRNDSPIKETHSLMLMITPRIIIQEEEE